VQAARFGFDDLKYILVERLGVAEDEITDDPSTTFEDMGLDSLAFIQLQLALEEGWGLHVPNEDAEHMFTVGEAIDYVNERLAEKGAAGPD
jgi:minimal PKS acyl carrier protein